MQVFSNVFYLAFCSPRAFLYFPLRKAASCSKYTYCHSGKLQFLSNLGSDNSPSLFWAYQLISLLNLTNPATTVLYHSSLFHQCDNTMVFLSFRLIGPNVHFLIFVWSWQNICGVLAAIDQHLILESNIALHWPVDLYSVIS